MYDANAKSVATIKLIVRSHSKLTNHLCVTRATVEANLDSRERMPPITVTIANNDTDFVIR